MTNSASPLSSLARAAQASQRHPEDHVRTKNWPTRNTAGEGYEERRRRVDDSLPLKKDYKRVAIFGSVDFYHSDSPALCKAIGIELSRTLSSKIILLTGANAVTHEAIARPFYHEIGEKENRIFHLAPEGYDCSWDFGTCLEAGRDSQERRRILATLSDVCISVEGGPNTVDEMKIALRAGKVVIPVPRSGGASNGMFDAPAIPRPGFVKEETWRVLHDETAHIEATAKAVSSVVETVLGQLAIGRNRWDSKQIKTIEKAIGGALDISYSKRPVLREDCPAYAQPTLAGVANKVFCGEEFMPNAGLGDIYLGPKEAAAPSAWKDLNDVGIGGIVNCTNRVPCCFEGKLEYCTVAVNDESGADILLFLDGATTFLNALIGKGVNVLVHCQMGVSRSSTVVVAYLIRFFNMTRDEAYLHVKARRPKASPNPGFWDQLMQFEDRCRLSGFGPLISEEDLQRPRSFDSNWAKASNALYATCHESSTVLKAMTCISAWHKWKTRSILTVF